MAHSFEMKNITIAFPGVLALKEVSFTAQMGTIQALIGANGAGKSTLMKVLAGVYPHYEGEIFIDNTPVKISSPDDALNQGIQIVYQEVDTVLIPYLSVAENIMLHYLVKDMKKKIFINWKYIHQEAAKVLQRLSINLDTHELVSNLTLAEKQLVLLARSIKQECKLLILDEPTAALSSHETLVLFKVIKELVTKQNIGVIFISHRIHELFEICEYASIMRDGKLIKNLRLADTKPQELIEIMLGTTYTEQIKTSASSVQDEVILTLDSVSEKENKVQDISLSVKKGEIVGIAGLVGAGKTELCKTIYGVLKIAKGSVHLNNKEIKINSACHAVKNGIALIPEERRKEGVLVDESVSVNLAVVNLQQYCNKFRFVSVRSLRTSAIAWIKKLGVVTPNEEQKVAYLSGGNQQKVVIGKWLVHEADIYIFDEVTKGIDVGAKLDMFNLIIELANRGKGIIYATCELAEICNIAHRSYVMFDGKIVKELNKNETNESNLLHYATGGTHE